MKNLTKIIGFMLLITVTGSNLNAALSFQRASSHLKPAERGAFFTTSLGMAMNLTPSLTDETELIKNELTLRTISPQYSRYSQYFQYTNHLKLAQDITDEELKIIGETCHFLESLDLTNNKNITEQGLAHLTPRLEPILNPDGTQQQRSFGCPLLKRLNVSNTNINNLQVIFSACPSLKELNANNSPITDAGLENHPQCQLLTLEKLHIKITDITGVGLAALARACPNLNELDAHCCSIADAGLENFPQLPYLKILNISNTQITGVGLKSLAQACPNLNELCTEDCPIADEELENFPELPCLKFLDISDTEITKVGLASLAQACKNLTALYGDRSPFAGDSVQVQNLVTLIPYFLVTRRN